MRLPFLKMHKYVKSSYTKVMDRVFEQQSS